MFDSSWTNGGLPDQASRAAESAAEREKTTNAALLRCRVEVAELKGQLESVRRAASSETNSQTQAYKSKILDLEVEVQRLKDALSSEKARHAPRTASTFVI
jgi:hypothetical protein